MASADAISISMIIIGVANTAGIFGTKCFTVRSGLTVTRALGAHADGDDFAGVHGLS